jgi:hypothetical protein
LGLRPRNYQRKEYINGIFLAVHSMTVLFHLPPM